jgi:hypothetical protein
MRVVRSLLATHASHHGEAGRCGVVGESLEISIREFDPDQPDAAAGADIAA